MGKKSPFSLYYISSPGHAFASFFSPVISTGFLDHWDYYVLSYILYKKDNRCNGVLLCLYWKNWRKSLFESYPLFYWEIIVTHRCLRYSSMLVWLTCIMKWWPQLVQLTSIFSQRSKKNWRKKKRKKEKVFFLSWKLSGFTLLTGVYYTGSHPVHSSPSTYWSCNWKLVPFNQFPLPPPSPVVTTILISFSMSEFVPLRFFV